jgi:gamma-glutamyltranspeptidase/glutathione hydrolase/leukotriene-C4 hydrolase
MLDDPDWKSIFAPKGKLLDAGDYISRPAYGETLRRIAEEGADVFYQVGWPPVESLISFKALLSDSLLSSQAPIARSLAAKVQSAGGILTFDDIAAYRPKVMPALEGSYLGRKVWTTQAPTSGPAVMHMLNMLERYDLVGEGRTTRNVHRLVETMKCE